MFLHNIDIERSVRAVYVVVGIAYTHQGGLGDLKAKGKGCRQCLGAYYGDGWNQ